MRTIAESKLKLEIFHENVVIGKMAMSEWDGNEYIVYTKVDFWENASKMLREICEFRVPMLSTHLFNAI